jgi:hypothetical protein
VRIAELDAGSERVEAMARTGIGAEMDASANVAHRQGLGAADAQLVDARRAHLDLDRQAQALRQGGGLARSRCLVRGPHARSAWRVSITRCNQRPPVPRPAASACQRGASSRSSPTPGRS